MVRRSILALALLMSMGVASADELAQEHIAVYGTATLQVPPNQMRWLVNVRNTNPQSAAAAEEHGALVASVMGFLRKSHVAEETIQTSGVQLGENWNPVLGSRERDGYFASTDVNFTLADFAGYAAVWTGLAGLPGVTVNGMELDHTDRIRFQNEARTQAVLAARDKARGMAEALGVRLGEPLAIEEDLSVSEGMRAHVLTMSNTVIPEGEPGDVDKYLAPGTIPIRARVKVVFAMLTQR
jgi:uncharacterized protein